MPTPETAVSEHTRELLVRPTVGQVRFSDVYAEPVGAAEPEWWKHTDYDAALTDRVESGGFSGVERIPIGLYPWMTPYGLLLTDDLVIARDERVDALVAEGGVLLRHPDVQREVQERKGAVVVLGNKAHRDQTNTEGNRNGSNFYLGITAAGTEYYVTPLSFLSDLEAQDRLTALYEIPNEGHPEFDGDAEQFRSARVTRTRRHPDHLVRVFDYEGDRNALRQAKADGSHPSVIPADDRPGRIAHVDKFGNVVLWLKDRSELAAEKLGNLATLSVSDPEWKETVEVEVVIAENLKSSPLGRLAVYGNCSTRDDEHVDSGLAELIARVDDDPNTSQNTAFFQLIRQVTAHGLPDLNPATAAVELRR